MKKRFLTMFLVVALICTLIVGSASAASVYLTIDGKACKGTNTYNSTFSSVTATSSFPDAYAESMMVKAYYSYTINGIADTVVPEPNVATNICGSISLTASRPSSSAVASSATSQHTFTYNNTSKTISPGTIYP